jgi:membrane associated rhomboid family serine protease
MQSNNILIIANILSFIFVDQIKWGLTPNLLWNNFGNEFPKLLTSAFTHANIMHLAFNMFALYSFGVVLESMLGNSRYFIFYILSAVLTSLIYAMFARGSSKVSLGASGAISAVMGLYMFKSNQMDAIYRVLQFQFVGLIFQSQTGINYLAHIIGFGLGWLAYYMKL